MLMHKSNSTSTDQRNLKNIYILLIYKYIGYILFIFIYYLYLYVIQRIFTTSAPAETHQAFINTSPVHTLTNFQINYSLTFFFPGCLSPWEVSLACKNSRPHSNSTYSMETSIRIITFIITANIYQLWQAKYLTGIILFHPHKPL